MFRVLPGGGGGGVVCVYNLFWGHAMCVGERTQRKHHYNTNIHCVVTDL